MKITAVQTKNFLGARDVDLKLTKPVCLVVGPNGSGRGGEAWHRLSAARPGSRLSCGGLLSERRTAAKGANHEDSQGQHFRP